MKTLLKNGRILDPAQNIDVIGSLLIEDDQVEDYGPELHVDDVDEIYDCSGLWICPGLVDPHVHFREPGLEHTETISSGTQAAAAGGFTNVCCMPNTNPPLDNAALIDFILDKAASPESGGVFVAPVGAVTRSHNPLLLTDFASMKKAGIVAVSDEGAPIQNSLLMQQAMETCLQLDLPLMAHCEDTTLSAKGAMNDGAMSAMLGLRGIPRTAEEVAIMRNCILAMNTRCQLHIMRVSTWGAVEMIRQAKSLGANVTCEVTPQHFIFTDESIGEFDPLYKMSPPLRTQVDIELMLQAINDGTIDCISSDHSPHAAHDVEAPFDEAPFGSAGLESVVGATLTHLTHKGVLSPLRTIELLSSSPARILRLDAGTLRPGDTPVAQVTVIHPDLEWTFDVNKTFSLGKNSPFHGHQFKGKSVLTFCGGEIYRDALFEPARYISVM